MLIDLQLVAYLGFTTAGIGEPLAIIAVLILIVLTPDELWCRYRDLWEYSEAQGQQEPGANRYLTTWSSHRSEGDTLRREK